MKIYNTMSGRLEPFEPLREGCAGIYACGPTVYDKIHIGNARQICTFDTLRRYLKYVGYDVKYVQNFTDVDDKIIRRAAESGRTPSEVSEAAIAEYFTDAHGLDIADADVHPKVTENMDAIIDIIDVLVNKGYAYESGDGDIYFDISKFEGYGKLSHRFESEDSEQLHNAAGRMDGEESSKKRNEGDFAVWKAAKAGEPAWEAVFGGKTYSGRPGWHIECSAMSRKYVGSTLDIHGGGSDLIFPHHENEIAQSESATGEPLAKYWMHNAMLTTDGNKMAKSKGNFFFVRDIAEKYGYVPLRLFLLSAHYRKPLNFSEQSLLEAVKSLSRVSNCLKRLSDEGGKSKTGLKGIASPEAEEICHKAVLDFNEYMDSDLNTAAALSVVHDLVRAVNKLETVTQAFTPADRKLYSFTITRLLDVLGIDIARFDREQRQRENSDADDVPKDVRELAELYTAARAAKDYTGADGFRDRAAALGYGISVTRNGVAVRKI